MVRSRTGRPLTKKYCRSGWARTPPANPANPTAAGRRARSGRKIRWRRRTPGRTVPRPAGPGRLSRRPVPDQDRLLVVPQAESDREPAQGQPADSLLDMAELGALAAQKLAAGRHVEEQIAHLHRRSRRMGGRNGLADDIAAIALDPPAIGSAGYSGGQGQAAIPRRCWAGLRRESRGWRPVGDRRNWRFCWWRGGPAPAPDRRDGCRNRCHAPGSAGRRPAPLRR